MVGIQQVDAERARLLRTDPYALDQPTGLSLQAFEKPAAPKTLGQWMWDDFLWNVWIVTVPAIFTNALWRWMNLVNIATGPAPKDIMFDTMIYIAPPVFGVAAVWDFLRQVFVKSRKVVDEDHHDYAVNILERKRDDRPVQRAGLANGLVMYFADGALMDSLALGFKFFVAVVTWTVGYVMSANTHMFYAKDSSHFAHSLGAGFGEAVGLIAACEIVGMVEYIHTLKQPTTPPTLSIGIATKGFAEGMVWSLIGDFGIADTMKANGYLTNNEQLRNAIDSFTLGMGAAWAFTALGLLTSFLGFRFTRRAALYQEASS